MKYIAAKVGKGINWKEDYEEGSFDVPFNKTAKLPGKQV